MSESVVLRLNPALGAAFLAVGVANLVIVLADGDKLGAFTGLLLVALGVLFCVGKAAVISPSQVMVTSVVQKNIKTVPIAGLADLELRGKVLHRRSDGDKIVNLGFGTVRDSDIQQLRALIDQASG